ncbi:MAG: peptidoglycan DD-metalloendopeptidase family protein [Candidatus Peribacteraceae bacterium]|nr:peptidoglycan DD-metalloendopeptidase family protein [Candidatus Peribacteraceae bacterium]
MNTLLHATHPSPFPLLGSAFRGEPFLLPLTPDNAALAGIDLADQAAFQAFIERKYGTAAWGLAEYLEYREPLLQHLPQMAATQRYFHLGLDVIAPVRSLLYAPLDGTVFMSGYEEGRGNYGGYVVTRHEGPPGAFFCLYGHLQRTDLPPVGMFLPRGEPFARIGDFSENGFWFHHTHIQLLTQRALDEGRMFQGYVTRAELPMVPELFPSPHAIFRSWARYSQ